MESGFTPRLSYERAGAVMLDDLAGGAVLCWGGGGCFEGGGGCLGATLELAGGKPGLALKLALGLEGGKTLGSGK